MNRLEMLMMRGYPDHLRDYVIEFYEKMDKYIAKNGQSKAVYWTSNNEYASLVRQVIKQLYDYIGVFGNNIHNFESLYGSSPSNYAQMKKREYKKSHNDKDLKDNLGIKSSMWKNHWKAKARQLEYHSMYGVVAFIEKLEDILQEMERTNKNSTFVVPNYIQLLASQPCGIASIDNENKKLLKRFDDCIEEDRRIYVDSQEKKVEENYIEPLKSTMLYKGKSHVWDGHHIGEKDSMTFSDLFVKLRRLASEITIRFDHSRAKDTKEFEAERKKNSYLERIKEIGNLVRRLDGEFNNSLTEKGKYTYTAEEQYRLEKLGEDISGKIYEIKRIYEQIEKNIEKHEKDLMYIDAINEKIRVIEKTINELNSEKNHDPHNMGRVSVFQETINMLYKEKLRCEELLRRHEKLIETLKGQLDNIDAIRYQIDNLSPSYNSIITTAKNRKEKEEEAKRQRELEELKRHKANLLAMQIEENQKEIDKVKEEILKEMRQEGLGPALSDFDGEKYHEDYTEFNRIFRERLIQALLVKGINFEGADLSNPTAPVEYHVEKPKEEEKQPEVKIEPTVDKDGFPIIKRDMYGKYIVTEDNYMRIFEIFEKKAKEQGLDYDSDEIIKEVMKYLDRRCGGIDCIENLKEFRKIVSLHQKRLWSMESKGRSK